MLGNSAVAMAVAGIVEDYPDVPLILDPVQRSGRGDALAVTDDYAGAFPFTGGLERVVIEVEGPPFRDAAGEAAAAIRSQ